MGELAGALSERVAIERWIDVRDDAGGVAGFWRAEGEAFAAVSADGGGAGAGSARDFVEGEARRSRRRWRVVLRAPVAVGLTSRLLWGARVLAVLGVEDDPRVPDRVVVRCEVREG